MTKHSLLIVITVALVTIVCRFLPFLLFPEHKPTPKWVTYLGQVLPPAMIGMLIVYCVKQVNPLAFPFGLPELLGILVVVLLHLWKGKPLLSICGGTVVYMLLVQCIFV